MARSAVLLSDDERHHVRAWDTDATMEELGAGSANAVLQARVKGGGMDFVGCASGRDGGDSARAAVLPWRAAALPMRAEFGSTALPDPLCVGCFFYFFFVGGCMVQLDTCQALDSEVPLFLASEGFSVLPFKIVSYRTIIQYAVLGASRKKKCLRKNYEISSAPNGFVTDSPH